MTEQWIYDLFISYAEADKAWVEGYLLDALEEAEVGYIRESAFTLGVPRILEFERAIRQSRYTLLVISEAYLADDLKRFTDILAQSYGEQVGTWPVIPLTLQEGLGLDPRLKMLEGLKASTSEDWKAAIKRLCEQLKCPPPPPPPKPVCPYPGMIPFSENDEGRFFGRDEEIEELLGRLRLHPFLTVIGPSGSGKSSLIFAGLIPQLKQSGLFGTGQWCIRSLRPGTNPLANLQAVLGGDVTALEVRIQQLLSTQPDAQRLLLIVDQFEELFTQAGAEATPFQQALFKLMEIPNVYLILTVRADFYPDLMGCLLWNKISSHRFEVLPLDEKGLKQAIVRPAEEVEVYVDPVLVERLVVDAKGEPGILPLIQETLVLLWEKLERRFLPLQAYELLVLPRPAYGPTPSQPRTGLQIAISRRADAAYANLETDEKQAIARRIFLRLIQFGEGRLDTRRQQLEDDLRSFEDDSQLFDDTLEYLASSKRRLLTFSGEESGQKRKVDIAHEALIFSWPTLQQWINELRESEKTRRRLQEKAEEWTRMEKKGGLLDEAELAEAESWLSSDEAKVLGYDKSLYNLIRTSRKVIEELKQEKENQRQKELRLTQDALAQEKKARKVERSRKNIALIFTIILCFASVWIWKQKIEAELLAATYYVKALKSNHQIDALIEGIKAGKILKNPLINVLVNPDDKIRVIATLSQQLSGINEKNVLQKHKFSVNSISFCHTGLYFVSGSDDGTIRFWNKNGEEKLQPLINDQNKSSYERNIKVVSINRKCDLVASSDKGGTLKLWKLDGSSKSFPNPKSSNLINSIKFSPNGAILASAGNDGMIQLWDLKESQVKYSWKAHEKPIRSISFSKDGDFLVSAGEDRKIKLWDLNNLNENKQPRKEFPQRHQDGITEVTFSPDDQFIASASIDKSVIIWTREGTVKSVPNTGSDSIFAQESPVNSVQFSPNGKLIATADSDNTVKLWDLDTLKLLLTLKGHNDKVNTASFSPDGKTLISAGVDNIIIIWDITREMLPQTVEAVRYSRDGNIMVIATAVKSSDPRAEGLSRLVYISPIAKSKITHLSSLRLELSENPIYDIALSSNGEKIAIAQDTKVTLWDRGNSRKDQLLCNNIPVIAKIIDWSSDGSTFATINELNQLILWKSDGECLKIIDKPKNKITSSFEFETMIFRFNPKYKLLVSADKEENNIILWKQDGTFISEVKQAHKDKINALEFSQNGKILVSAGNDGAIKLWNLQGMFTADPHLTPLNNDGFKGHTGFINSVAISPNGQLIASGGTDKVVRLWNLEGKEIISLIGHNNLIKSLGFSPDGQQLFSVDEDGIMIRWNLDLGELLNQSCQWLQDYNRTHRSQGNNPCKD